MTRKPRSKFNTGNNVILDTSSMSRVKTEGIVLEVIPMLISLPNRDTFAMYRYIVQLENAVGAFGASRRFVYEKDLRPIELGMAA